MENVNTTINPEVIAKIRKLLALSQSPNEAEAALAASKAQELLLRHNLDLGVVDQPEEQKAARSSVDGKSRRSPHEYVVAHAVCDLLDVRYFLHIRKRGYRRCENQITFVGLAANVETAIITFNYILAAIDEIANSRKQILHGPRASRDYKLGAATRISADIKKRKSETMAKLDQKSNALVLVGNQVAEREYKLATANAKTMWHTGGATNAGAYGLGYSDGAKINPQAARTSRQLASGR